MICAAAKGFLTQSDCGASATTLCANCHRPMCTVHLAPQSGFTMCLDCAATQQPAQKENAQTEYDDTWAHGYRSSYYSTTGYRPYHDSSSSYDRQDAHSFDERRSDSFDDETERDGFDAS